METRKMIRRLTVLGLALFFTGTAAAVAGNPSVVIDKNKLSPQVNQKILDKVPRNLCADLKAWSNYKLGPRGEFPFETGCKNCWLQVGVMNMVDMGIWIENGGTINAPASMAKLTWASGKPPYNTKSIEVSVPALRPGEKKLLTISVPRNEFFQISKAIKLELDSRHAIRECNEGNNVYTYRY